MQKRVDDQSHNSVTIDGTGVILVELSGKQTGETVLQTVRQIKDFMGALRAQRKRTLVLTDLRRLKLSDISNEARIEAKRAAKLHADAGAILLNPGLKSLLLYVVQVGGDSHTRIFTNPQKARAWLKDNGTPQRARSYASLIGGISMIAIGLMTLIGWQANNPHLYSWIDNLPPMNPRAAIGLLVAGFGFCCYWFGNLRLLKIAGVIGVAIGVLALLPIHVDSLFWEERVRAAGPRAQLADSAAICFIALGLSPFTIEIKRWWRRPLQYGIAAILFGVSLFNIFGQLYAHEYIYGLSKTFVMSFNLAVAFTIAALVMVVLVIYRKMGPNITRQLSRTGALLLAVLVFVQIATYGAWLQAFDRNQANSLQAFYGQATELQTSLNQRVQAYLNALAGFKGLFAASDYVDQGEFEAYYDSLNLNQNYPGLRALSFISRVQTQDLSAFASKQRADKSLHAAGNPTFKITNQTADSVHYIVTYVADSNTVGGNDLSAQASRLQAFKRAETLNQAVSSGTIEFPASATAPAQRGFFLTIPVTSKAGSNMTYGFVNAVFNYSDFFAKAYSGSQLDNMSLTMFDPADNSTIYKTGIIYTEEEGIFADTLGVVVADHAWNLVFTAPKNYSLSYSQSLVPRLILTGGQLFSLLLIIIFVIMLRSRRQGYALADRITEDLQYERNQAVANDQKSSAILASIGDAVFAIDTKKRIRLFNPSAERVTGFTEHEVLSKPYDEILKFENDKTGAPNREFIREALAGKLASMADHTILICKDGRRIPVADSAAPIHDSKDGIQGAIIVFRDVTKEYELEKAKTEFVSLASHQLRTPLSAINWYGEMLLSGDAGKLSKDQHEYIREIFEGNQRMVELVDSLLNVSRLEIGKLPDRPVPTDIPELIESLHKEVRTSIEHKKLKYNQKLAKLPVVRADPKQLRMVFQNLMSNAVKYTPDKGEVTVTLRRAEPADIHASGLRIDEPCLYFSVKDNGFGIPKTQQDKIFGKMFRADNVRAMDVEGTGLGLYIVKEVVEKMGGRVWFESIESVGTTFHVVLPFKRKAHKQ